MPVFYEPQSFFRVAFALTGTTSAWKSALGRSCVMLPLTLGVWAFWQWPRITVPKHRDFRALSEDDLVPEGGGGDRTDPTFLFYELNVLTTPFTLLLGLVTAFRLKDAFAKWERATELILGLHRDMRSIMSRLCAFLPPDDPHVLETIQEIRRLLLLGCVLLKVMPSPCLPLPACLCARSDPCPSP